MWTRTTTRGIFWLQYHDISAVFLQGLLNVPFSNKLYTLPYFCQSAVPPGQITAASVDLFHQSALCLLLQSDVVLTLQSTTIGMSH